MDYSPWGLKELDTTEHTHTFVGPCDPIHMHNQEYGTG